MKRELADLNVLPDDWGGKIMFAPISAKQGQGIDELLDRLILLYETEKEKITANPNRNAVGTIIESHIDKGAGPVATVLIQGGTLRVGDALGVSGAFYGKVRAMRDYKGASIKTAEPSVPAQVLGWKVAPVVGDVLEVSDIESLEKAAKSKMRGTSLKMVGPSMKQAAQAEGAEEKKMLQIILKADVLGSMEAILGMFQKVRDEKVGISVLSKALGSVTEADVTRASASGAIILAFGVGTQSNVEQLARDRGVEILSFDIIYKMFDEVLKWLDALLGSEVIQTRTGKFEVIALFKKIERGQVVGGKITDGFAETGAKAQVWRNGELIGEGTIKEIRIGKEVVREVQKGNEAGLSYIGKTAVELGDVFELFSEEVKKQNLKIEK